MPSWGNVPRDTFSWGKARTLVLLLFIYENTHVFSHVSLRYGQIFYVNTHVVKEGTSVSVVLFINLT